MTIKHPDQAEVVSFLAVIATDQRWVFHSPRSRSDGEKDSLSEVPKRPDVTAYSVARWNFTEAVLKES